MSENCFKLRLSKHVVYFKLIQRLLQDNIFNQSSGRTNIATLCPLKSVSEIISFKMVFGTLGNYKLRIWKGFRSVQLISKFNMADSVFWYISIQENKNWLFLILNHQLKITNHLVKSVGIFYELK